MMLIFFIGCVLFSSASAASGKCPEGFVPFGGKCYFFSNDVAIWINAQVACNEALYPTKSYLVEINSKEENDFLWTKALRSERD
ncbi:hypothetical protein DPMN_013334 [Dreissena polymorpha]|uniref:C-type lectin domain-containing protein n=1 Tax=Dreissena polymorpha TaxID=45954 RepID=A0A9D4N785_DREPO|nr:hypothetical protein DPMN_013334 [Dreissena polymorpha]